MGQSLKILEFLNLIGKLKVKYLSIFLKDLSQVEFG